MKSPQMAVTILAVSIILLGLSLSGILTHVQAQPTPYALTLQRFDFQPVSIVPPGTNTYSSPVTSRTNFVMAFRNGIFQRPCPTGVLPSPGVCDYWISGLVSINYPPGMIQPFDLVSLVYYP